MLLCYINNNSTTLKFFLSICNFITILFLLNCLSIHLYIVYSGHMYQAFSYSHFSNGKNDLVFWHLGMVWGCRQFSGMAAVRQSITERHSELLSPGPALKGWGKGRRILAMLKRAGKDEETKAAFKSLGYVRCLKTRGKVLEVERSPGFSLLPSQHQLISGETVAPNPHKIKTYTFLSVRVSGLWIEIQARVPSKITLKQVNTESHRPWVWPFALFSCH